MQKALLFFTSLFVINIANAQFGKKKKEKEKIPISTDYTSADSFPDTLTKFTGIIKYRMTSDDPADKDSMFVIFGENQIRFTMFMPGYKANEIFENNMIADFRDTVFYIVDVRKKTYSIEKLGDRNPGIEFALSNFKKKGLILQTPCKEYSGEMQTKEGDLFQVSTLVSDKHSYIDIRDYNFMNIQPAVMGYKIVLAYKSKSANNENTMIVAYKIEPGDTNSYFDLSEYRQK
jgi:hypothetical protein